MQNTLCVGLKCKLISYRFFLKISKKLRIFECFSCKTITHRRSEIIENNLIFLCGMPLRCDQLWNQTSICYHFLMKNKINFKQFLIVGRAISHRPNEVYFIFRKCNLQCALWWKNKSPVTSHFLRKIKNSFLSFILIAISS